MGVYGIGVRQVLSLDRNCAGRVHRDDRAKNGPRP
jgi:hypothetical protein